MYDSQVDLFFPVDLVVPLVQVLPAFMKERESQSCDQSCVFNAWKDTYRETGLGWSLWILVDITRWFINLRSISERLLTCRLILLAYIMYNSL